MPDKFPTLGYTYDRHHRGTYKKEAVIEIRVCHNGKKRYISTGVTVLPKHWKDGKITGRPDAPDLNRVLSHFMDKVSKTLSKMWEEDCTDITMLPERLKREEKKDDLYSFIEERSRIRMHGKAEDTQQRYQRFIRLFRKWGKIKTFTDINEAKIIEYDEYLTSQGMKPYSRWQNYHRFLSSFIEDMIKEGLAKENPYRRAPIDKSKTPDSILRCLTPDELKNLEKVKMPTKSLERVKDLFLLQTYTCMAYTDLENFDPKNIRETEGMKVYTGRRVKTGILYTIPLVKQAIDILEKYNWKIPIISNEKYNEYLKLVAQAAGIDKPVTSHWARHTGATILLNSGVDIHIVARICGHSSIRITEKVYARLLDKTVVEAIKRKENIK